ncbi:DUF503 domain-containing protein [Spirochaetota bacterium]
MHISILVFEFRVEGCRSLKEKRQRLSGLRDRIGRFANVAVCETAYQNDHQRAEWSFVIIAVDDSSLSKTISIIENDIESKVDALIVNTHREKL